MKRVTMSAILAIGSAAIAAQAQAPVASPYRVIAHWRIGGESRWDYLHVDPKAQRLYVSHGNRVEVLDAATGKPMGAIDGLQGSHGIEIDGTGKFGYISDGAGGIVIFDTRTFAKVRTIPVDPGPDGIIYEPVTRTMWTFNGRKGNASATAVDTVTQNVAATLALPDDRLESVAADGKGHVFGNYGGKIARIDAKSKRIDAQWTTGCDDAAGLAYDLTQNRVFQACRGGKMAVVDATSGKVLGTAAIGERPDGAGYSAKHRLAFASTGDGVLTVVDAGKPGFPVAQKLETMFGARTMDYDPIRDRAYTISAERDPNVALPGPPPSPQQQGQAPTSAVATPPANRPSPYLADTFQVVVIGR